MRLHIDLSTEFLRDKICIPIFDEHCTVEWVLEEIKRRYDEWHKFKVYDFDLKYLDYVVTDDTNVNIYDFLGLPRDVGREVSIRCSAFESEQSIIQREEDRRLEEEEKKRRAIEKRRRKKNTSRKD